MAQKPEIQYVGRFYVHGSEARKLAEKEEQKKTAHELPLHRFERIRKVYVDPLAIGSILMAAVLLVTMVMGALSMQTAWQELGTAQEYVYELEIRNSILTAQYRSGYDLEEVRSAALAMGMIPVEEAQTMQMRVTVPEQRREPNWIEDLVWLLEGMFA